MSTTIQYATWTQRGVVALQSGASGTTVQFPITFFAPPFDVVPTVTKPNDAAADVEAFVYGQNNAGFAYTLSTGTVPDNGYMLSWAATAQQPSPQGACGGYCPPSINGTQQCGYYDLQSGVRNGTITFPFSFPTGRIPKVLPGVIKPNSGAGNIYCTLYDITETSFSFSLSATTPSTGYRLTWEATIC